MAKVLPAPSSKEGGSVLTTSGLRAAQPDSMIEQVNPPTVEHSCDNKKKRRLWFATSQGKRFVLLREKLNISPKFCLLTPIS